MDRATRHMLNRDLARGWDGWASHWSVLRLKRDAMRKSLGHLLHRQLSRGCAAWQQRVREGADAVRLMRRGLSFMVNRELANGLSRWRRHLHVDKALMAAKSALGRLAGPFKKWKRAVSGPLLAAKAIRHALHRELARSWQTWRSRKAQSQRALMAKAVATFVSRGLAAGFRAWLAQKQTVAGTGAGRSSS